MRALKNAIEDKTVASRSSSVVFLAVPVAQTSSSKEADRSHDYQRLE